MDPDRIADLARLSRLELSPEETERARQQLEALLGHFDALQSLDTEGVAESPYPRPITLRVRPDQPGEPLPQAEVLQNAPVQRGGQFLVPKVIDA